MNRSADTHPMAKPRHKWRFFVTLPRWPDGLRIHEAYNRILHDASAQRENVHLVQLHNGFLSHGLSCGRFWRPHYRSDDPQYW